VTTTALLSPVAGGDATQVGRRLYRKQILPETTIKYKGRAIKFDEKYLTDLAQSFQAGAYDQVAVQFADKDNKHTLDPRQYGGEVRGVEYVKGQGLFGLFDLADDAAELIRKNPKLGVSARIVEGLEHHDGTKFPRAMHHVLLTTDPRVTGMKSWEAVDLSEDEADETIDLSDQQYDTKEGDAVETDTGTATDTTSATEADNAALSAEAEDEVGQEVLRQLLAEIEAEEQQAREEATVGLSNTNEQVIDTQETDAQHEVLLARVADQEQQIFALQLQNAQERFDRESTAWVAAGVPPALIELARPVLTQPYAPVIDLSNSDGQFAATDVAVIVRKMLDEAKGFVELSREDGSSFESEEDADEAILNAWNV